MGWGHNGTYVGMEITYVLAWAFWGPPARKRRSRVQFGAMESATTGTTVDISETISPEPFQENFQEIPLDCEGCLQAPQREVCHTFNRNRDLGPADRVDAAGLQYRKPTVIQLTHLMAPSITLVLTYVILSIYH